MTELLHMSGALVDGHFELLEGLHTNQFFRFSTVARDSSALDDIARWVAPDVRPLLVDAVLAPTTAGVGLGWTLATSLGVPLHLATVDDYGRPSGILGEPHLEDHRILLVNDVMTTGRGMQRMARLAEHRGAAAAAAVWFLSRSELDAEALLGVPCFPVAQWHFAAWDVHACDACAAGGEPEFAYDLN